MFFAGKLWNRVEQVDLDTSHSWLDFEAVADGRLGVVITEKASGSPASERFAIESMQKGDLPRSIGCGFWLATFACSVSGGDLELPRQTEMSECVLILPDALERAAGRIVAANLAHDPPEECLTGGRKLPFSLRVPLSW